jgi:hypothetical protein
MLNMGLNIFFWNGLMNVRLNGTNSMRIRSSK